MLLNIQKFITKLSTFKTKNIENSGEMDKQFEKKNKKRNKLINGNNNTNSGLFVNYELSVDRELKRIKDEVEILDYISNGNMDKISLIQKFYMNDKNRFLFENKDVFQINQPNLEGVTPLYIATTNGHVELVKELLKLDANPNILCKVIFTRLNRMKN